MTSVRYVDHDRHGLAPRALKSAGNAAVDEATAEIFPTGGEMGLADSCVSCLGDRPARRT